MPAQGDGRKGSASPDVTFWSQAPFSADKRNNTFPYREPRRLSRQSPTRGRPRDGGTVTSFEPVQPLPAAAVVKRARTLPAALNVTTGMLSEEAPPLPLGSMGGRFSASTRFAEIRLPTVAGGRPDISRRGARLQSVCSQRWVPVAPPSVRHLGGGAVEGAPLAPPSVSLTTGLFPQSWQDSHAGGRDAAHARAGRSPGYMLIGHQMTPKSRRDMQLEELLQYDRLGLSPAPTLYFGRGFSNEPRSVRIRKLQRDTEAARALGDAQSPPPPQPRIVMPEPGVDFGAFGGPDSPLPSPSPVPDRLPAISPEAGPAEEAEGGAAEDDDETKAMEGADDAGDSAEAVPTATPPSPTVAADPSGPTGWEGTALDPSAAGST
mmetsp:Transcript_12821/g.38485  ORF Transcript_12821/g.38485 Transcript_12821/m.38485 type:complete len:377 (-) Transcript_12821:282-1412(-)